jgi:hypothetical protein
MIKKFLLSKLNKFIFFFYKKDFAFKKKIRVIDGIRNKYEIFNNEVALGKGLHGYVYRGKMSYWEKVKEG